MRIDRLAVTPEQQAEQEYADFLAARAQAVQDYNIMIGNLEDPEVDEEGEING